MKRTAIEVFVEHIDIADNGCWLWTGRKLPFGYGRFSANGPHLAHRFSYEFFVGPIPQKLTIDHLCRVPSCVNPDHLEPVTLAVNVMRGNGYCARKYREFVQQGGTPKGKSPPLPRPLRIVNARGVLLRAARRASRFGDHAHAEVLHRYAWALLGDSTTKTEAA